MCCVSRAAKVPPAAPSAISTLSAAVASARGEEDARLAVIHVYNSRPCGSRISENKKCNNNNNNTHQGGGGGRPK